MGMFTVSDFNSFDDLLMDQLRNLYDAEHRLTDALPKMAAAAVTRGLKEAFLSHLEQTKNHVRRLESAFAALGKNPERGTCQAMKGLISDGSHVIEAKGDSQVRDAALIAAAQCVEHYEMAAYGSARAFAKQLNLADVAALLQQTLDEERAADQKLTGLAETEINYPAAKRSVARV
jgi:ferritin-like metal-binding protein YciE